MIWLQFFTLLLSLLALSSTVVILDDCARDLDCEKDYFCHDAYCSPCIPCVEILNRLSPFSSSGKPVCARQEDDCGACLPEYQAEDLVNGRRSSKCYPEATAFSSISYNESIGFFISAGIGLFLILPAIALVAFNPKFKLRFSRPLTTNHENPEEIKVERPQPSAPYWSGYQENQVLLDNPIVVVVPELGHQHLSQAVPIGNYHGREDVSESIDEIVQHEPLLNYEDSESSLDSSETIPSHWSPFLHINYERSISLETPARLPIAINELPRAASYPNVSAPHIRLADYQPISPPGLVAEYPHVRQDSLMSQIQSREYCSNNNLVVNEGEAIGDDTEDNNNDQATCLLPPVQSSEDSDSRDQSRSRPRSEDEESMEIHLEFHLKVKRHKKS